MFIAPIILLPFNIIMHYVRSYIFYTIRSDDNNRAGVRDSDLENHICSEFYNRVSKILLF